MASRAILRRRKIFSDYLNVYAQPLHTFQNLGCGQSTQFVDSRGFSSFTNHLTQITDQSKDDNEIKVPNEQLLKFTSSGLFWHKCNGTAVLGYGSRKLDLVSPIGVRSLSQSLHYSSTAVAKQSDLGSDNEENEVVISKKKKEASPEDCYQAVVGLSTVKAKAKAKKLQESQKVARSILQRTWAMLLGIGPALRAVASMSREDWAKKLVHWKNEFKSTLQHYSLLGLFGDKMLILSESPLFGLSLGIESSL